MDARLRAEKPPELGGFARVATVGDARAPNALVVGENLAAMRAMHEGFAGRFRFAYFDPPFNTGRAFDAYDDRADPRAWREAVRARLDAARPLLADDGAIAVEIDDTELGSLQLAMDEVFGREHRVSTITIVRSATTGHKAKNRGPVNVTDYLLLYAKDKKRWRCNPLVRPRAGYDAAYGTFLVNREAPEDEWRFVPLARRAAEALGEKKPSREAIERFAIEHAASVVRFAQPRFEAVSHAARALIERSRAEPDRVMRLARARHEDMLLKGGNRILFLKDKVRVVGSKLTIVEPLTNVWDDVPFQGIAREGGVVFARNKKPERLLARLLAMATDPGDWVLDAYLGSGTTAAVAQKMGRGWIGIEQGEHAETMCIPRLSRVVSGEDSAGISREVGWTGGGGFGVFRPR